MNHSTPLALSAVLSLTSALAGAGAAPLLIDDFNSYSSGSYLQQQGGLNWSRFGTATSDGIYSVAGGSEGRGASYLVTYAQSGSPTVRTNGSVRYTFSEAVDYSTYSSFSIDLRANTLLEGTQVYAQVTGTGTTPTIFETLVGQSVSGTDFTTFQFQFTEDTVRQVQGAETLDSIMENLKSITFRFVNTTSNGSQTYTFDQFMAHPNPIPEPSSLLLLLGTGALGLTLRRLRSGKSAS